LLAKSCLRSTFVFFRDQWKILNVPDTPPALALGAQVVLLGEMALFSYVLLWRGPSSG